MRHVLFLKGPPCPATPDCFNILKEADALLHDAKVAGKEAVTFQSSSRTVG